MNTAVEFKSELFKPFLPEECQVNPECYGAELSFWLARRLADKGINTSYPNFEDWGWFIEYVLDSGEEYWLCCGNVTGSDNEWRCFLDPKKISLFGKKADVAKASQLLESISEILEAEEGISDIRWSVD